MIAILQNSLAEVPRVSVSGRALPGTEPLPPCDWLRVDEAYGAQMAARDALIATRPRAVHRLDPGARPVADEALVTVLDELRGLPGFAVGPGDRCVRPDGTGVTVDRADPLPTLGRLCAEDFCLLERRAGAWVLTGAILCFPSGWTLEEKFLRPMAAIHRPVVRYDADVARRVDRLLDGLQPDRPICRVNATFHDHATLFAPRREADPEPHADPASAAFLRSERQVLQRLPVTGAVLFSILTRIVPRVALTGAQVAAVAAYREAMTP